MSSIEEIILDEVRESRKDQKKMVECMSNIKVELEKTNGKIHVINNELIHIKNDQSALRIEFEDHEDDKIVHFNEGIVGETAFEKVKRNAAPYGIAGVSISSLVYLVAKAIEYLIDKQG